MSNSIHISYPKDCLLTVKEGEISISFQNEKVKEHFVKCREEKKGKLITGMTREVKTFFKENPEKYFTMADVREILQKKFGNAFRGQSFPSILLHLCKKNYLRRGMNEDGEYEYALRPALS